MTGNDRSEFVSWVRTGPSVTDGRTDDGGVRFLAQLPVALRQMILVLWFDVRSAPSLWPVKTHSS